MQRGQSFRGGPNGPPEEIHYIGWAQWAIMLLFAPTQVYQVKIQFLPFVLVYLFAFLLILLLLPQHSSSFHLFLLLSLLLSLFALSIVLSLAPCSIYRSVHICMGCMHTPYTVWELQGTQFHLPSFPSSFTFLPCLHIIMCLPRFLLIPLPPQMGLLGSCVEFWRGGWIWNCDGGMWWGYCPTP